MPRPKQPFICKSCFTTDVTKQAGACLECHHCYYMRTEGSAIRERGYKRLSNGMGKDPAKRKVTAAKVNHNRRAKTKLINELDAFVFEEAVSLAVKRSELTGFPWSVDHIIPLHHKAICGLHVASNFQVVPSLWNSWKGNRNTDTFLGTNGRTEANQT